MLANEFWQKNPNWNPVDKKILLYSGGSDSWLISKLWKPDLKLYINIHGRYSENEISRLPEDVVIEDLDLSRWERADAIVPMRNLYFVILATNYGDDICLGATAGDRVLDKSPRFAADTTYLLSYLYSPQHWIPAGRHIKVNIDYKMYTKKQMMQSYMALGGNLEDVVKNSFSCYDPIDNEPCMSCKPCFRKAVAAISCGYTGYTKEQRRKLYDYINRHIMPDILDGIYGRGIEEETDITNIYNKLNKEFGK